MRIAIDLRMVGPIPHGIARYALALWAGLPAHPDRTYVALTGPRTPAPARVRPGDELLPSRSPFLSPLEQIEVPALLRRAQIDLFHATSFSVPALWRGPLVLSLHDLTHLAIPEFRTPARLAYYGAIVGPAARRAKQILTVSQYSKALIATALRVPSEHITVAPNAVEPPPGEREAEPPAPVATPPMLLAVGSGKPHKNLALLIEVLRRLTRPSRLVLAGTDLSHFRGPGIEIAAGPDDAQLWRLYRTATLFLCPSRCEGFGLPALEAALAGAPVLAARAGALPEIWEGAAAILPADDAGPWVDAVDRLLADETARTSLAARCHDRSQQYRSWNALLASAENAYGLA